MNLIEVWVPTGAWPEEIAAKDLNGNAGTLAKLDMAAPAGMTISAKETQSMTLTLSHVSGLRTCF